MTIEAMLLSIFWVAQISSLIGKQMISTLATITLLGNMFAIPILWAAISLFVLRTFALPILRPMGVGFI
jgi:hypothetical protein